MARPTAWMTSIGLLRGSRNATALSDGESVPSPKIPHVQDPVWAFCAGLRQPALALFAEQNIGGCVQVFESVLGCGSSGQVVVQVLLNPSPRGVGLQVLGHVPGLVHRIHEGDAGLHRHLAFLAVVGLGGIAHCQGERQAAQLVVGGERLSFALGCMGHQLDFTHLRCVGQGGYDLVVAGELAFSHVGWF